MATTIIDELRRIQQSKINMRSVIESKGVGVDPEATIDKYPDFIEQISDSNYNYFNYVTDVYVSNEVEDLGSGFMLNYPKIENVTINTDRVPKIDVSTAFIDYTSGSEVRPCPTVYVFEPEAYRADDDWAFLEEDGRIILTQFP